MYLRSGTTALISVSIALISVSIEVLPEPLQQVPITRGVSSGPATRVAAAFLLKAVSPVNAQALAAESMPPLKTKHALGSSTVETALDVPLFEIVPPFMVKLPPQRATVAAAEPHEIVPPFMMRVPMFLITLRSSSTE